MPIAPLPRASRRLPLVALALGAACGDTSVEPEDREVVAQLSLAVAPAQGGAGSVSVVTLLANGQVLGGPLRVPVGRSVISARPLDDAGRSVSEAVAATLRLMMVPATGNAAGLTFERNAATQLAGNLTAAAATPAGTTVAVNVGVQRVADAVWPLGPFVVPVMVTPAASTLAAR